MDDASDYWVATTIQVSAYAISLSLNQERAASQESGQIIIVMSVTGQTLVIPLRRSWPGLLYH